MKATGIVRRIDDLGRVVIPKAIREQHRIYEGDPLEIFLGNDGEVIFKKYQSPNPEDKLRDAADLINSAINEIDENRIKESEYQLLKSFADYINERYEEE